MVTGSSQDETIKPLTSPGLPLSAIVYIYTRTLTSLRMTSSTRTVASLLGLLTFANDISLYLPGFGTTGVFDRFPELQAIVGDVAYQPLVEDVKHAIYWIILQKNPPGNIFETVHESPALANSRRPSWIVPARGWRRSHFVFDELPIRDL